MPPSREALNADWLGACRRATEGLRSVLAQRPTTAERARETGTRGKGGDHTLEIDASAESIVLDELARLHEQGHRFCAFSEEKGAVDFGSDEVRVIIDPIDGSLNAKRGIPHHALSVAVAAGSTMADVVFAYVYDFGPQEEWWARRGEGARLNGSPVDRSAQERCDEQGRLEVLGIESADPRWMVDSLDGLLAAAHRVRALGTIAATLCQVAAARFDGMVSLRNCRAVDAAAGQLIVREAGGLVSFPRCEEPLGLTLDAQPRSPVVAARSERTLARLVTIPR